MLGESSEQEVSVEMADRSIGLVLSGGGAKGSFSAGAVDYLIREKGLRPSIITGTSAGSICAAVLSQARSSEEFYSMAATLREDIVRMSVPDATFVKQPWLSALDGTPAGEDIERLIRGKSRPPIPADPTMSTDVLAGAGPAPLTPRRGWEDAKSLIRNLPIQHKALKRMGRDGRSIMLLDPLEAAFRGQTPGRGAAPIDEAAVARPGLQLRLTITALGAGRTRFVTESGSVVEDDGRTPVDGSPDPGVIEGVLASSSVPMVFPPRPLGADVYADGGLLQNIPLAPALALGAQDVYLVLAGPLSCPAPVIDYSTANLLEVGERAEVTVPFYEQQRRDVARPVLPGTSTTTIDPTVTAVSTFETEPGLLTINMDYGWLRACGETPALDGKGRDEAHHLADLITVGRLRDWYLNAAIAGSGDAQEAALGSARKLVADSLAQWQALGLATPKTAGSWASSDSAATAKTPDMP
jgi:NTE family protein